MKLRDIVELGKAFFKSAGWADKLSTEMDDNKLLRVFLLCRKVESVAKKRKEEARDYLMTSLEANEKKTGTVTLDLEDGTATRLKKLASSPNAEKVKNLLVAKGLSVQDVVKERKEVVEVVDVSVLDGLVATGKLSKIEVESCYPETFAFTATESKDAKKALLDI